MSLGFRVIGITGRKRSGKNTVGELIRCLADRAFLQVSLADPIKDGFDRVSGPGRELHKDLDNFGWSNRKAWQILGTEAREDCGDNLIWAKVAATTIVYLARHHPRPYSGFYIPDIRFRHEQDCLSQIITRLGGTFELWMVTSSRSAAAAWDSHKSEQEYGSLAPDVLVSNNSTKAALASQLAALLRDRGANW